MKVSAILTVVSICLAGIVKAAPVGALKTSGIVILDEYGKKEIDLDYLLSSIEAIASSETKDSSIAEKTEKIVNSVMKEIQEQGLLEKFLYDLVSVSQLQDGFEESGKKLSLVNESLSPSEKRQFEGILEPRFISRNWRCRKLRQRNGELSEEYQERVKECKIRQEKHTGVAIDPIKRATKAVLDWFKARFGG